MSAPGPGAEESTKLATSNAAIRTLLLCDLVASTQLVEGVGDHAAADLLARHDRVASELRAAPATPLNRAPAHTHGRSP